MKDEKKKEGVAISKSKGYSKHNIHLGLEDIKRCNEFNKGKEIIVTKEELNTIGVHRWMEIKNG